MAKRHTSELGGVVGGGVPVQAGKPATQEGDRCWRRQGNADLGSVAMAVVSCNKPLQTVTPKTALPVIGFGALGG